ncbi:MAG TPA: SDR family oxidoreductase [Acidimicrobiia bacterium]|jgi:NAD(P)-dependent dehydrogenase (short-subunit alcohol dehydrogenase family)
MTQTRVAVVTGASAGVGRATAVSFAEQGFDVALLARGSAGLDAAAKEVERAGGRPFPLPVDVASFDEIDRAAKAVEIELGPIDVWVNNAMATAFSPFTEISPEDFERAIAVTFLGQVWGTKAALELMLPRDEGTIVNVGSALAFIGIPLQSPYCAAKFACRGFAESVRSELLHIDSNVRLCVVHLPAVNTPQFDWAKNELDRRPMPVPPIYQPEYIATRITGAALDGETEVIIGAWNKMLVGVAKLSHALANNFAAISAWDGQLTGEPSSGSEEGNLHTAADATADYGAHGRFDACAHGFFDPSFLRSLPKVARQFTRAARETLTPGSRSGHS